MVCKPIAYNSRHIKCCYTVYALSTQLDAEGINTLVDIKIGGVKGVNGFIQHHTISRAYKVIIFIGGTLTNVNINTTFDKWSFYTITTSRYSNDAIYRGYRYTTFSCRNISSAFHIATIVVSNIKRCACDKITHQFVSYDMDIVRLNSLGWLISTHTKQVSCASE